MCERGLCDHTEQTEIEVNVTPALPPGFVHVVVMLVGEEG